MARPPRLDGPGLIHHVIHRGNNRQRIFADSADYGRFVDLLEEGVVRFGHDVFAFCLMPNHVHLLIRTQDVPISRVVQNAAFRFAAWSNRRLGRVGHVFQGRFRSFVVSREGYLLALVRYIHQNPVRAGMVASPDQHAWNSHRDYLGPRKFPWVRPEPVLAMFDPDLDTARRTYRAWSKADAEEPEPAGDRKADQRVPERSLQRTRERLDVSLDAIVAAAAKAFGVTESELRSPAARRFSPATVAVAVLLRECGECPVACWARVLGRDAASVSRSLRRFERRSSLDSSLRQRLDQARASLGLPAPPTNWLTG